MSVLKIEITENHLKLLKHLQWGMNDNVIVGVKDDGDGIAPPFGENNIYEAIDLILNGVPNNFDPLNEEEFPQYTQEQKDAWDKLYSELPRVLDVILFTGKFETGIYKTKFHLRNWEKQ